MGINLVEPQLSRVELRSWVIVLPLSRRGRTEIFPESPRLQEVAPWRLDKVRTERLIKLGPGDDLGCHRRRPVQIQGVHGTIVAQDVEQAVSRVVGGIAVEVAPLEARALGQCRPPLVADPGEGELGERHVDEENDTRAASGGAAGENCPVVHGLPRLDRGEAERVFLRGCTEVGEGVGEVSLVVQGALDASHLRDGRERDVAAGDWVEEVEVADLVGGHRPAVPRSGQLQAAEAEGGLRSPEGGAGGREVQRGRVGSAGGARV